MSRRSQSLERLPSPGQDDLTIMDKLVNALDRYLTPKPMLHDGILSKAGDVHTALPGSDRSMLMNGHILVGQFSV